MNGGSSKVKLKIAKKHPKPYLDGLEKPADCNSDTPENNNQNNNKLTYDNLKGTCMNYRVCNVR